MHSLPDLELVVAHIVTKGFTWNGTTKMASGTPAYLRTTSGSSAIFAASAKSRSSLCTGLQSAWRVAHENSFPPAMRNVMADDVELTWKLRYFAIYWMDRA